jgi:hypothetical protein
LGREISQAGLERSSTARRHVAHRYPVSNGSRTFVIRTAEVADAFRQLHPYLQREVLDRMLESLT